MMNDNRNKGKTNPIVETAEQENPCAAELSIENPSREHLPKVGITHGDTNGVGYELIMKNGKRKEFF